MNRFEKHILALISRSLGDKNILAEADAPWGLVYALGKSHMIIPLLSEGLAGTTADEKVRDLFLNEYKTQAYIHFAQANKLNTIADAFEQNNIDYIILKGSHLKSLYPKPEMRIMADCDILIKPGQYDDISKIMERLGFFFKTESNHEYIWTDKKFTSIELHKRLVPSYNPLFSEYFDSVWHKAKTLQGFKHQYVLPVEDEFLFIFTHFTVHYRDGGIGIKHMVDLYLFKKFYPDMDMGYIKEELEKLGLDKFFDNVFETISVWFDGKTETPITEKITHKIFKSGSFGESRASILATAARYAEASTVHGGRIAYLKKTLFPSMDVLKNKFPILDKFPILLPFCWLLRCANGILFKFAKLKGIVKCFKAINKKSVDDYLNQLDEVGLDKKF